MTKYVGKNIPRFDGHDKATGRGLYTADIYLPHMLHAAVLRSPYAHAKIISIDVSEAEKMDGVVAVATKDTTTDKLFNTSATMVTTNPGAEPVLDQQIFPEVVRYVGDEVAAVAAETEEIAKEALKKIKVVYEELPAVYNALEAMKDGAPQVQPDISPGNNLCETIVKIRQGDVDAAWEEGEVFAEHIMYLPRVKQAQLETHGAVASYNPDGRLKVYSTTQTPYPTKMILAHIFEIPSAKIQVLNPPYVGGGFGVRIGISGKAEIIASALSILAKRPVKYIYSREEDFLASDTRHGGQIKCRLAAKKDGTFVALDTEAILNTGAYATFGVELLGVCGACGTAGTYRIPNLRYDGYPIYTNQQTAGAFRGFGTPQGTFAVERCVDSIALQLGMDPLELRYKNLTQVGDDWWFPFPVTSTYMKECLEQSAESIGWKEKRGKKQTGTIRRGVGIACGTHVSNASPFCVDYDAAYMRIESDGSLHVASSIPEIGPGVTTGLLQIAADTIGVPLETSRMVYGDTDAGPFDIGSHASRTLYAAGFLFVKMGNELKKQILDWAAKFLYVDVDRIDLVNGEIVGNCDRSREHIKPVSLGTLAYEAHLRGKQFMVHGCEVPTNSLPWHAHAAEVEVDMETGMVKVLKVAAAHDVGVAINPVLVEGQIEGAVAMGVGYAIREEMTYEEGKGFYNDSYHKYMLPTMDEMPELDTIIVDAFDPAGPYGAKGIGECGVVPTAPAIVSAVEDAIGISFYEIPLTPGRVLKKIKEVYGDDLENL
jgi:xanthine dehydrogenase molybdenum-binding subunit